MVFDNNYIYMYKEIENIMVNEEKFLHGKKEIPKMV